ncbi:hypothetical protein ABIB81_009619 [Bradyrhizobium sp. I1.7.5]
MTARCRSAGSVIRLSSGLFAHCQSERRHPSQVVPQFPEERVPNLSFGRLRAKFHLSKQFRSTQMPLLTRLV